MPVWRCYTSRDANEPVETGRTVQEDIVSDKDFFFEDDEVVEEASKPSKPEPKRSAKSGSGKSAPAARSASVAAAEGSFLDQTVSMQVTVLVAVIALLIGVIAGFMLAPRTAAVPVPSGATTTNSMGGGMDTGTGTAPELSQDQINQGMPAGHPPVGESAESSATE